MRKDIKKDNIFRPERSNNYRACDQTTSGTSEGNHKMDLGSNFNVGLAHFFSLPKLDKNEAADILEELKIDMEASWTPSKLVNELNKHIISQDKAKRIIAQAVRNKYRMR